jgi:hypothetical protein
MKAIRKSKVKKSMRYINFINDLPYRLKQQLAERMNFGVF